ncbi:MAG: L-seryl-tRNA(Sec) selenium transferase [Acidobacteria bacterium]|nr:L-seryl-tRNA(Sec) selenium transferase [Acidobacteriota bacterium]
MASPRSIPSIDQLLQRPALEAQVRTYGRPAVVQALREAADVWRAAPTGEAGASIEARAMTQLNASSAPSLTPVINATGVIVHTNLGRAPLARVAVERAAEVAAGYSNLEYDLGAGTRGSRHVHAERLLCALTGAEAAVVTSNNAAATMLVLATLAAGREVIVSRGELVEIGGGFRVPDIMAQSGAILREVGTTNRTRVSDYAAAISDRTALILRVHPSNFRIEGFTERPALADLASLAHRFNLPLFEDLGSGWLGVPHTTPWPDALRDEPSVRDSVAASVDLIAFSGDKLLGGPQCGLIVGRAAWVDKVRRHPLMRAVRAGKQTYAALEATLALWQQETRRTDIPVVAMLVMPLEEIDRRGHTLATTIQSSGADLTCEIIDGASTIGGGAAPQSQIPTRLLSLKSASRSAASLEAALRAGTPPVITRIQQDVVLLDLRTVAPEHDALLAQVVADL